MGSILSGRRGWRGKCEHKHRVDVRQLKRWGYLRDGARGSIWWARDGERTGTVDIRTDGSYLRFIYRWRRAGETDWKPVEAEVGFQTTLCHFGGARHWFICRCNRRCAIVYVDGPRVGCRECMGLAYASQSEDEIDRTWRRIHHIQRRLGAGEHELGSYFHPDRPKGMHRATFERLSDEMADRRIHVERLFQSRLEALEGRLARYDARRS